MFYLLAQTEPSPVEPTERQVKAAEIAVEGFLKGIEGAAAKEPTNYLVIVAIVATLVAAVAIVILFLRYLKTMDENADRREAERQKHLESMADKYASEAKQSQRECHAHSREMIEKRNADSSTFKGIAHHIENAVVGLTGTVKELAGTSHDFKAVAHDMRGILQQKQIEDEVRSRQTIDVNLNPPPKIEGQA
jgi:hypothetical protein